MKTIKPAPTFWFVENSGYWFIVCAHRKSTAKQHGRIEYGRHFNVREATQDEVDSFRSQKGETALWCAD